MYKISRSAWADIELQLHYLYYDQFELTNEICQ